MSEETNLKLKSKLNKKLLVGAVAVIATVLVATLAIFVPRVAEATKLTEQLNLGDKYLSELQYEQAEAAYLAAIEIDPKNVDAYLGLADVYIAQGEYDKAIEVLEDALDEVVNDAVEIIREKLEEVYETKEKGMSTPEQVSTLVPTLPPYVDGEEQHPSTEFPAVNEQEATEGILKWKVKEDGTIVIVEVLDKSLSRLEIPIEIEEKQVTEIGNFAFYCCGSMEEVLLPEGITSIGMSAFAGCDKLTKVVIPDGVIKIGDHAFESCSLLNSIILPNSVQEIGNCAFLNCLNLKEITLSNQLETVGDSAFSACFSLESVYLPESLKSLGNNAFFDCRNLSEIYIPQGIDVLGDSVFGSTKWVRMNTEAEEMVIVNDVLYRGINQASVVIPEGVTRIAGDAFYDCREVRKVSFPDSLVKIDGHAFLGTFWDSPGKLNIAGNIVYSVGANVFGDVEIPEGIISISDYAFAWNERVTSVHISASVKEIGEAAFLDCPNLTIITPSGSYAEQYAIENGIPYRNE